MNNLIKGNWIKLYRKLLNSAIFDNENLLKVWIWALLKANHTTTATMIGYQRVTLQSGEFIFGRNTASEQLKMSPSMVYRCIVLLEKLGKVNIKKTNKFSIISIKRWTAFQGVEQQMNNKWTTNEQQMNTDKNDKNVKKIVNEEKNFYLNEQVVDKVKYLAERMNEPKHLILYLQIAEQIGIDKLEHNVGLTLESANIRNPGAYLVKICKNDGYKSL